MAAADVSLPEPAPRVCRQRDRVSLYDRGVGAIFAPFIAGHIADRFFKTEKYLAISHIVGGVLVWQLSWIEDYWLFFAFAFLYSMIYAPTLALTNSLSFHHLPDRDRQFGKVRLWGTIG